MDLYDSSFLIDALPEFIKPEPIDDTSSLQRPEKSE